MAKVSRRKQEFQSLWEKKISRAKKVREAWKKKFRVELGKEYFEGNQNPGYPAEEWITINKIYSHIQARLPSLYPDDPYFYVKLKRSFTADPQQIDLWEQRGESRAAMLNYLSGELELKTKVRLCVQDAQFSYGVIKTHLTTEMLSNPDAGQQVLGSSGEPLTSDVGEPLLEPELIPVNERYKVTRVHPDDFIWDEDAGCLHDDWSWVAQRVRMKYGDAKKDPRFDKAALKSISENLGETSEDEEERARDERKKGGDILGKTEQLGKSKGISASTKKDEEIIVTWEIYHLDDNQYSILAEGASGPLMDRTSLPPGVEKHPFSILRFTLRDDSPYPIPPVTFGLDPQKELNLVRSRMVTHRKRYDRRYEVVEAQLAKDEELDKLEVGGDGTYIRVMAPGTINPIKDAPLDQQTTYAELGVLSQDLTEMLGGTADEVRGIAGADSATQAAVLDKHFTIKESDAKQLVVEFVRSIARKLDQLVQANITKNEAVKILGGPSGEFWRLIQTTDYDEIAGEYAFDVNWTSQLPNMPHLQLSSFLAFLNIGASAPWMLTVPKLVERVAEMNRLDDKNLISQVIEAATAFMQSQQAQAQQKGVGSQAGVSEDRPVSSQLGSALGSLSLGQPGAGNIQG